MKFTGDKRLLCRNSCVICMSLTASNTIVVNENIERYTTFNYLLESRWNRAKCNMIEQGLYLEYLKFIEITKIMMIEKFSETHVQYNCIIASVCSLLRIKLQGASRSSLFTLAGYLASILLLLKSVLPWSHLASYQIKESVEQSLALGTGMSSTLSSPVVVTFSFVVQSFSGAWTRFVSHSTSLEQLLTFIFFIPEKYVASNGLALRLSVAILAHCFQENKCYSQQCVHRIIAVNNIAQLLFPHIARTCCQLFELVVSWDSCWVRSNCFKSFHQKFYMLFLSWSKFWNNLSTCKINHSFLNIFTLLQR